MDVNVVVASIAIVVVASCFVVAFAKSNYLWPKKTPIMVLT